MKKIGVFLALFLIGFLLLPGFSSLKSASIVEYNVLMKAPWCSFFDYGARSWNSQKGIGCDRNLTIFFDLTNYSQYNASSIRFRFYHQGWSISPGSGYLGVSVNQSGGMDGQSWGTVSYFPGSPFLSNGSGLDFNSTYNLSQKIFSVTISSNESAYIWDSIVKTDWGNNSVFWGELEFNNLTNGSGSSPPTTTTTAPTTTTINYDDPAQIEGGVRNTSSCRFYAYQEANGADWGTRKGSALSSFICQFWDGSFGFILNLSLALGVLLFLLLIGVIIAKLSNKI